MSNTERAAFQSILQKIDLSMKEYISARKTPEPAPSRGASEATAMMYKKAKWPGECCTPNHPTLYDAEKWYCAKNTCMQPELSDEELDL